MTKASPAETRRHYDLGKRLEQMDESRAAILRAARAQLEENGYRQLTMSSLAEASGVTRQTIHNLFGTRSGVLEALFDVIALDGGMQTMRSVMMQTSGEAMLAQFVQLFCGFWAAQRLLYRRVHGIGAIDPEFSAVIEARNQRRRMAAGRVVRTLGITCKADRCAATLAALTSFEFFDALAPAAEKNNGSGLAEVEAVILQLARASLTQSGRASLGAE